MKKQVREAMSEYPITRHDECTHRTQRREFLKSVGLQGVGLQGVGASLSGWRQPADAAAPPQREGAGQRKTRIMMCVDYNDMVASNEELFDEELIDRFFSLCAAKRIERVYWRVSATGNVLYHSQVRTVFCKGPTTWRKGHGAKLRQILSRCDPLEVAVRLARKHGLEIYPWVTIFDDGKEVMQSQFSRDHPQYLWLSRDQKTRIDGVLCYFYPEVISHRLAQVRELLAYGVDGLLLSTRSHSRGDGGNQYGFNAPAVQRYRERYGTDPLRVNEAEFQKHHSVRFHRILGEQLTGFLSVVAAEMGKAKLQLAVPRGATLGYPLGPMELNYPLWARRRLIDGLLVGAMEWIQVEPIPGFPYQSVADSSRNPEFWNQWYIDHYQRACGPQVEVAHWLRLWGWLGTYRTQGMLDPWVGTVKRPAELRSLIDCLRQSRVDGVALFEAASLNFDKALWDALLA